MVTDEHIGRKSPLPVVLYGLYNGADPVLDALKANVSIQFLQDFVLGFGDKAFLRINIRGAYGLASPKGRLDRQGFSHAFCQVTVVVAKIRLAHEPGEMALEGGRKVFFGLHAVFFGNKLYGKVCEFLYAEGLQLEFKLKQAVDVRIVPQEVFHVVENAAENHYGRAFGGAHAGKELVQLVDVRGLCGGDQFLGIGNEEDTVFQGSYVFVEISGKFGPVGGVYGFGRQFGDPGRHHFGSEEARDESFAGAGVAKHQAVHSKACTASGNHGGHFEAGIQFVQY